MNYKYVVLGALALVIGFVRPLLDSHPLSVEGSYEAFAHLFVGGLIGAWLVTRELVYSTLVVVLSLVELGSAMLKS